MHERGTICVIDDEAPVRTVTRRVLESHGFRVVAFESAEEFFAQFEEPEVECVVTDLRMPGLDGEQVLRRLRESGSPISVIVITGHAAVSTAVHLMEEGAVSLLEKPFRSDDLVAKVHRALELTQARRKERAQLAAAVQRLARLTSDEHQVLKCLVAGLSNKAIAIQLDMSLRTIDRRKGAVLEKMKVNSISELSALVTRLQLAGERIA